MALQHKLCIACSGVPELDSAVLGAGEDPVSVGGEGDGEDEVFVPFEGLDAAAAFGRVAWVLPAWCDELPHLDGFVETAGDEVFSVWCECDGVDGVFVSVWSFKALDEVSSGSIPYAHTLVERSGGDVFGIGRDGDGGDTILDAEREDVLTGLDIPETNSSVATARSDSATIASEVQGVDVLLVSRKGVSDGSRSDIPDLKTLAHIIIV